MEVEVIIMRRFGWKNKSQSSETIGWWKIKCNYCGEI